MINTQRYVIWRERMADFKRYILRQYACNQKTNGELTYSQDSI